MSEKRFTFYYERGNEVVIEDNGKRLSNKKVVDLLNTMSDEIEEVEISIKLFEDDVQVKDKKISEQQATIEMYQRRVDKREEQISIIKKHCLKFLTDEQFETIRKELENE